MTEEDEKGQRGDRDAALLTKAQRGLIRGEKTYSQSAEREIRRRIRHRLYNGILDLTLIARELPVEEIDQAFANTPANTPKAPVVADPTAAMTDFNAIQYLVHREVEQEGDAPEGWRLAMDVENGLELALTERLGVDADISVDIEITRRGGLEELAQATDDLTTLSIDQLSRLLKKGHITSDEHAAAFRQKSESGDI